MEQSHRDDKGVEEKEVRNYRVKERKTPDGRIQLTGSEDAEQEKVVCWAKLMSNAYPDLELLYHVPNGGSRNKAEASKLRRMGVRAGVPDLVLPVPRAGYAGLYIELKVGENRPSNSQKDWLEKLTIQGYQALVCYGGNEAIRALEQYVTAPKTILEMREESYILNLETGEVEITERRTDRGKSAKNHKKNLAETSGRGHKNRVGA